MQVAPFGNCSFCEKIGPFTASTWRKLLFGGVTVIYVTLTITLVIAHLIQEISNKFSFERHLGTYHDSYEIWSVSKAWPSFVVSEELYVALWAEAVLIASVRTPVSDALPGGPHQSFNAKVFAYYKMNRLTSKDYQNTTLDTPYGNMAMFFGNYQSTSLFPCYAMGWFELSRSGCHISGNLHELLDKALHKMYTTMCNTEGEDTPIKEAVVEVGRVCVQLSKWQLAGTLTGKFFIQQGLKSMKYNDEYRKGIAAEIDDPFAYTHIATRYADFQQLRGVRAMESSLVTSSFVSTLRTANTTKLHLDTKRQILESVDQLLSLTKPGIYSQSWKYPNINYIGSLPVYECIESICERHTGDFMVGSDDLDVWSDTVCFADSWSDSVRAFRSVTGQIDWAVTQGRTVEAIACEWQRELADSIGYDSAARNSLYYGLAMRFFDCEVPQKLVVADTSGGTMTIAKPSSQIFAIFPKTQQMATYLHADVVETNTELWVFIDAGGAQYMEHSNRWTLSPMMQWMFLCSLTYYVSRKSGFALAIGIYLYNSFVVQLCGILLWVDYYMAIYTVESRREQLHDTWTVDYLVIQLHAVVGYFSVALYGGKLATGRKASIIITATNTIISMTVSIALVIRNVNYLGIIRYTRGELNDLRCGTEYAVCYTPKNNFELETTAAIAFALTFCVLQFVQFFCTKLEKEKFSNKSNHFFQTVFELKQIEDLITQLDYKICIHEPTKRLSQELKLTPEEYLIDKGLIATLGYTMINNRLIRQRDIVAAVMHYLLPSYLTAGMKLTYTYWPVNNLVTSRGIHTGVYATLEKEVSHENTLKFQQYHALK